ncbi:MAG TPA: acetyltransferase [Chromatiales bacterium]|nr:acetyltransferase [Chromatiales bacterium]
MFLKERKTGHLVEVLDLESLIDPNVDHFRGRYNYGEDLPDPEDFAKADVVFPSGEPLPRCWVDLHYRDDELRH